MKKLNNMGFTLVELLAIIVILAIILIITIPAILSAMDNSKKGSLEDSAKGLARWFENAYVSDQLESSPTNLLLDPNQPSSTSLVPGGGWECISAINASKAKISLNDYNIIGQTNVTNTSAELDLAHTGLIATTCSMIRRDTDSRFQVTLVAKKGGKLWLAGANAFYVDTSMNGGKAKGR